MSDKLFESQRANAMKAIFTIVTLLIAYGSLYPFNFSWVSGPELRLRLEALTLLPRMFRGDILGNFVLFLPFGFFGVLAFVQGRRDPAAILLLTVAGVMLALVLQLGQLALPTRDPSLFDVALNALGMAAGFGLACIPCARRLAFGLLSRDRAAVPFCLAGAWTLSQWVPLVPTLDFSVVKGALKPLVQVPLLSLPEASLYLAAWLAVLHMLSRPLRDFGNLLALLPIVVLAVQPFLVGGAISLGEAVGTAAAIVIWLAAKSRLGSLAIGSCLLVATLISNLMPLDIANGAKEFQWMPFAGLLQGNMATNSAALLRKMFLYGSVLWLWGSRDGNWRSVTLTVFVLIATQEALQLFLSDGTPEITDPLLVLMAGIGLAWVSGVAKVQEGPAHAGGGRDVAPLAALSEPTRLAPRANVRIDHLGGLDGLRAIAALSVFGVHFNQTARLDATIGPFDLARLLANGNTGVALFFVLSGFLLSLPFWRQAYATGSSIDVKQYFLRRFARILPAYYLCLFGLLAIKFMTGSAPSINNMLAHVVFLHNLSDYNILSLSEPFWTLAVEMQFYFLLPILMLTLRGLSVRVAFVWVLALAIGSYLANYGLVSYLLTRDQWPVQTTLIWPFSLYIAGPRSFVLTYSTLAHLTYFLTGMATAQIFATRVARNSSATHGSVRTGADLMFWLCVALILLILSTPLDDYLQAPYGHYNWPIVPILLAAMIFVSPHAKSANALLESRLFRWLGAISYGIYIFHYPLQKLVARTLSLTGHSMTDYWWAFGGLSLAATLAVATASYLLLERPVMNWARGRPDEPTGGPTHTQPASAGAVSKPQGKGASSELPSDDVWINIKVRLGPEQHETLAAIAEEQRVSMSAAARQVLAEFISDCKASGEAHELRRGDALPFDENAMETCRINLHGQQREFLLHTARAIGGSIDEVFGLIVDQYGCKR